MRTQTQPSYETVVPDVAAWMRRVRNGVTLPHILLVVADDLGYNDVGSVSNSIQRTKVLSLELKELKELYD